MKPCISLLYAIILTVSATVSVNAAVSEGENLLLNGSFNAEQVDFPGFWTPSNAKDVAFERAGGPEGKKASVVLKNDSGTPCSVNVRQAGTILVLVPGETYKLSGYIKTKNLKSRHAGVVVHNDVWNASVGFTDLPADSDWTFKEKTFKMVPSDKNEYGLAMFAKEMTGEICFTDLKLEAVSEKAREGSNSRHASITAPRLVPLQPLLNKIPHAKPEMTFKFFGDLPSKRGDYECFVTIDGNPIPGQAIPLDETGMVLAKLAGLGAGDYKLKAVIRNRETKEVAFDVSYPISIVDMPTIDRSNIKQLNNLVAEVLNQPVKNGLAAQSFTFANPREGWIFVAFTTDTPSSELAITIDDSDTVITAKTDRLEAFRNLSMGEHHITVSGNRGNANLIVHSIPEILNYPPCTNSYVNENGKYDWAFMKEHILCAVTTLNGGSLPGESLGEAKAMGLKWLANFCVFPLDDPLDVQKRMTEHAGMTQPQYEGVTCDELFFQRANLDNYTKALWQTPNPDNRLIYTWIVGQPLIASAHTDFISASLNASKGRARLLYEAYCYPQPTEAMAAAYLDNMLCETMRRFNAFFPNAAAGSGIILGNFNQIPILSLEHDPAIDYKYYLDMQVNLIANSPDFKNLATTGYWGTYYGDEELARWSFMLMRHYAVEGNKGMLSEKYGFKYKPGFLANCDFADGLSGWTVSPAAKDSIRSETISGFGAKGQGQWGGREAGDTICLMKRIADKPNRISQTVSGLEVGKAYCLQFVTADFKDVTEKKHNPRKYGIDVELDGVEMLPAKSFVHVDRRQKEKNDLAGKTCLNRIIFRAKSPTLVVTFSDEKAMPGEELVINFIQLKPYLE